MKNISNHVLLIASLCLQLSIAGIERAEAITIIPRNSIIGGPSPQNQLFRRTARKPPSGMEGSKQSAPSGSAPSAPKQQKNSDSSSTGARSRSPTQQAQSQGSRGGHLPMPPRVAPGLPMPPSVPMGLAMGPSSQYSSSGSLHMPPPAIGGPRNPHGFVRPPAPPPGSPPRRPSGSQAFQPTIQALNPGPGLSSHRLSSSQDFQPGIRPPAPPPGSPPRRGLGSRFSAQSVRPPPPPPGSPLPPLPTSPYPYSPPPLPPGSPPGGLGRKRKVSFNDWQQEQRKKPKTNPQEPDRSGGQTGLRAIRALGQRPIPRGRAATETVGLPLPTGSAGPAAAQQQDVLASAFGRGRTSLKVSAGKGSGKESMFSSIPGSSFEARYGTRDPSKAIATARIHKDPSQPVAEAGGAMGGIKVPEQWGAVLAHAPSVDTKMKLGRKSGGGFVRAHNSQGLVYHANVAGGDTYRHTFNAKDYPDPRGNGGLTVEAQFHDGKGMARVVGRKIPKGERGASPSSSEDSD